MTAVNAVGWLLVAVGALAWLVSGAALGVLIGKSIRNRDRQVTRDERGERR